MNKIKPSIIAFIASLSIALLSSIFLTFFFNNCFPKNVFIIFLLLFTVSFFIILIFNQLFIYSRVKQLYDSLRKYRTAKSEQALTPIQSADLIRSTYKEIHGWADDRKNELDQLTKLENYRKEFLGNVSHELKTPIFNIQGYILTLLDGGLEDKTINKEYLMRAEKSIDRMITIIGDLESISQLETGQLEVEYERFDVVQTVKEVFEAQELKAASKGIMLRFKDAEEKPVWVFADRFRIRQVLTNLIVNSINYGKEYGETKVRFYYKNSNVVVEIADNGLGIASEHLPRLFERFYRADKGRSREQGGSGLGLAIVKHILEAHNQTINVTSTLGVGSVFFFTLKSA